MNKPLTIAEVEAIAHRLAQRLMTWDEPIPEFSTRFPNILESCLLVPFQTYGKKFMYKGVLGKAAMLFYLMIKNHPFQNGNKRIAVTTLLVFLAKYKKWLKVSNQELYNFAVWVAASSPKVRDAVIEAITTFVKTHLVAL